MALLTAGLASGITRALLDVPVDSSPSQFGSLVENPVARIAIAAAAIVGAPLFEELLFRGLLLRAMLGWGRGAAVVVSSALFAIVHLNPELPLEENAVIVATIFAAGAVLAWLVLRTGRLGPSMVAHLCFNLPAVVLLLSGTS